jgi:2-hydroxy-3-keto-5-methylthiopentenyl-1-phosphate phosphatase
VNKAAVVRHLCDANRVVAFAGDGYPDFDASLLVDDSRRFARSDLAETCRARHVPFQEFDDWAEVVESLLDLA